MMSKLKKIIISIISVVLAAFVAVGVAFLVIDKDVAGVSLSESLDAPEAHETVDVGREGYTTLEDYVADNLSSSSSSQKTLVLTGTGPYHVDSQINIPAGKYITIDLNGASIFAYVDQVFYVEGTLTIIDSSETIKSYGTVSEPITLDLGAGYGAGSYGYYTLEREPDVYEKYYVRTGTIFDYHTSSTQKGMVQIAAGGTFNMYGGSILASQSGSADANSKGTMVYAYGSSSSLATFNMYGGFICAKYYTGDSGRAVYGSNSNINLYGGLIGGASGKYGPSTYMCNSGTLNIGGNSVKYGSSSFDAMYIGGNTSSVYGNIYTIGTVNTYVYSNVYIFENQASHGSIIYACGTGRTTVYGGTFLNNYATTSGGIVMSPSPDTFVMSGGYFYGNKAGGNGGAIWLWSGASANITGGTFSHNEAGYGGAFSASGCDVSVSGATFEGNIATRAGGGLYSGGSGTLTIKNSTFTGNYAGTGAGGVYSSANDTFTISNVTIKDNESGGYAGGLRVAGSGTISNSTITGNYAATYGGGVCYTGSSVSISDTEISGNTAGTYGGGLYMNGTGDVSLSGLMVIAGNSAGDCAGEYTDVEYPFGQNVYMMENYLALGGTLSASSSIGVTLVDGKTQITSAESSTSRYKTSAQYFFLDEDDKDSDGNDLHFVGYRSGENFLSAMENSEATMTVEKGGETFYSADLSTALTIAAGSSEDDMGTITLTEDIDVDTTVTVEAGTYVALDLCGCTITWTGASKSNFFMVYGSLDLYDSTAEGGKIEDSATAGVTKTSSDGGTVYTTTYGVVGCDGATTYYYYTSGAITGGDATGSDETARGGGVYVGDGGKFTMYSGTIYGNTSTFGGGVHNYGTFTMYGGAISENYSIGTSASYNGSAFLNEDEAEAYLYGGVIYGNVTSGKGYGVIDNLGTLYLYAHDENEDAAKYDTDGLGPVISGNTSSGYGGILNRGSLTMEGGYITLNHADLEGGGVNTNGTGFEMKGGYITGNTTSSYGAGLNVIDTFTMYGGFIGYNESSSYAGGVNVSSSGTFMMYGGQICGNVAATYGGGIASAGTTEIHEDQTGVSTLISKNKAGTSGGGVSSSGALKIYGGTISENTAGSHGGGVSNSMSMWMYGGMISQNTAKEAGGVYTSYYFSMTGGCVSENEATGGDGGGVYVYNRVFTLSGDACICKNYAYDGYGGGVYGASGSSVIMDGGNILYNHAEHVEGSNGAGDGGGIHTYGSVEMSGGVIAYNEGYSGGGVYLRNNSSMVFSGGEIINNTSYGPYGGGGVCLYISATLEMTGGTISGNMAYGPAGGVYINNKCTFTMTGGEISKNLSASYGGGVWFTSKDTVTIGGDAVIEGNYGYVEETDGVVATGVSDNLHLDSGVKINVNADFSGTVYIYLVSSPKIQVSSNEIDEDAFKACISGSLLSDQGYCIGYDGYVYAYEEHDEVLKLGVGDDGNIYAYYFCEQCFIVTPVTDEDSVSITFGIDSDGNLYAYAKDSEGQTFSMSLEGLGGFAVENSGTITWYPTLSEAIENAVENSTIILCEDIEGDGLEISTGCAITLDLNGHTIEGNVTAKANSGSATSLTICDSLSGGEITGTVSGGTEEDEGSIKLQGGTYYGENIPALADGESGYYAVYVGLSEEDGVTPIYKICSEDEIAACFYVEDEGGVRIYYENIDDAVAAAKDVEGGKIVLASDAVIGEENNPFEITSGKITIDLNGHALEVYIEIDAGSVEDDGTLSGAGLSIEDGSEGYGSVTGEIKVSGTSSDTGDGETNSFESTLKIAASAVAAGLTVDTSELSGAVDTVAYTFAEDENGNYSIIEGHGHVYNIAEAFMAEDGKIYVRIKCSCGVYYVTTSEGEDAGTAGKEKAAVFAIPESGVTFEIKENGDGTISYVFTASSGTFTLTNVDGNDASAGGDVTLTYSEITLTMTPTIKIVISSGDDDENPTVYYLDEDSMDALGAIMASAGEGKSVTVTLLGDVDVGELVIAGENVTIDLNGNELSGKITLESSGEEPEETKTSLEITDSSAGEAGLGEGSAYSLEIEIGSECEFTVSGGTYGEGVQITDENAGKENATIRDYVKSGEGEEPSYAVVERYDGSFTVANKDTAESFSAVKIEVEGETDIYFGSIEAALDYIENGGVSGAKVVLLNDCECVEELQISSSVTIDLNGKTLTADIVVEGGAILTIEDLSAENGSVSGTGTVYGEISVDGGTLEIYSGSYATDVGAYVKSDESADNVLYAAEDADGNILYTVVAKDSVPSTAEASITYEVDGGTVTVYYESIEDAVRSLKDGDTLTILTDVGSAENPENLTISGVEDVTIDLGGHDIYADITVEGDSEVTIKDSDENSDTCGTLHGSLSGDGDITVESGSFTEDVAKYLEDGVLLATSKDGEIIYTVTTKEDVDAKIESGEIQASITYKAADESEVTVYYESATDAISSLKGGDTVTLLTDVGSEDEECSLEFTYSDVSGNSIDVTLDLNGCTVYGDIEAGTGVNLVIVDGGVSGSEGFVTGDIGKSGNGDVSIEGGIYGSDVSKFAGDGFAVLVETSFDDKGEMSYVYEVVLEGVAEEKAIASVTYTYTDEYGEKREVTVWFDDIQSALDFASEISSGEDAAEDVTLTLTKDCITAGENGESSTYEIKSGTFTVDTGSCTTDINLEISGDARVTIIGEGEIEGDITVKESAFLEISGDVSFTGEISGGSTGEDVDISISGGAYATNVSQWTEEGFDVIYSDGAYYVKKSKEVTNEAAASVTITVDGVETTTYYESFEDALKALYDAMENDTEGEGSYKLTLLDDVDVKNDISESSELLDEDGALILEGNFTLDLNGHTFTGDAVVSGSSDDEDEGSEIEILIDGGVWAGDLTIEAEATAEIDLGGGKFIGDITVGDSENGAALSVTDSSEDFDAGYAGSGSMSGNIIDNMSGDNEISVSGGSYSGDVSEYVDDKEYAVIIGEGGSSIVVPAGREGEYSEAYVTVGENKVYYESIDDAIKAATESGGTVTLTSDASMSEEVEIGSSVTIDLAGFDLEINVVIDSGSGGSLKIEDTSDGNAGELSGSIRVVGEGGESYENVLTMEGGVTPGGDLEIDLSEFGEEGEFIFAETEGESGETTYGITSLDGHEHSYTIAVWTLNEDGTATVSFMCACGKYLADKNGNVITYTATVLVIGGEDGVYEFEASVSIDEQNADGAPAGEYSKSWTVEAVAVVEADGKTYYMTDLGDAIELAEKLGGTVTLYEDYDGDIEISGDVEINLNGHDINGTVTVDTGAYLIISGEGFVSGLEVKDFANVKLRGGTYGENAEDIEAYVDYYEGYAVFVGEDGYVSVMREDMAATKAKAAVTDKNGNTVYYEDLDEAVEALEDGFTLTLWEGIGEGEMVLIDGLDSIEIDANGFSIEGELVISNSDGVTVNMDGGSVTETGSVTFIDSNDATLNMGGEAFSGGNIEGQVKFEGSDNSSVNMDGGAVTGTGSVEFTNSASSSFNAEGGSVSGSVTFDNSADSSVNMGGGDVEETGEVVFTSSDDSSFNAEGGNIDGTVSFTGSENASLTMGCDGEDGGNIDGHVSFEGCDGATVDMDGGDVGETGVVKFTDSDDSSFNAEGGDIEGTVSFTDSENASLTMGCDGEDGGKIDGRVSFDGCDGATVDMDGGSLEGEVSFSNLDGSEFNLGGGTVGESGEVNFNQSEDSVINLGGGTFSGIVTAEDGSFVEITGSGDATKGTFEVDDGSGLSIHGGTYSNDALEKYYEESDGYVVVENEDDTSTVMTTEEFIENAAVSVTYVTDDGEIVEEYFASVEDALKAVKDLGNTDIVVKLEGNYSGDIEFDSTGSVTFDLAGHTVSGDISITGSGTLTIIDSEGGAFVDGNVSSGEGSGSISIEGGSYSEDVSGFVESDGDKTYVTVIGQGEDGDAVYSVMTKEEAEANSYVYIETYDEETGTTTRQYYETLEDAIANLDNGAITLTGDLDVSDREIEITTGVIIDTNGYTLNADFVIVVGDGENEEISGSLSVEDTSDAGTGSFTGKVTVKGSGSDETEDYSDAFILDGTLSASGLEVDLSGLGEDGSYHFELTADGNYGIVSGGSHSFTIPVWSVAEDGSITLELKCECGEYLEDAEGKRVVFILTDATVEETKEGLHVVGTVEATYTYVNGNGVLVEVKNSYDCDMYIENVAATVVTEGGELYVFEDVQAAVDFAAGYGGYVTLYEDAEDISVNVKTQEIVHEDKVPETDEDGNYVYDEDGNLIYEVTPQTDENGDYVYDEDGNLVYTEVTVTWVETVYTDVVIDLNGRNIGISVQADKGNSVTLTDSADVRGWADVGLSVDGVVIFDDVNIRMSENVIEGDTDVSGEIWIRGETTIDLSDMTIFNVTEIEGNLTLTGEEGSSLKLGGDIDLSDGSITIEGSTGIDLGGCDLITDITVSEGASFDFNLNGATFTGDIDMEEGSSITIRDSSVNGTGDIEGELSAEGDCDITIYDGVYDPYDSSFDITLSDSQILQSATDLAGDTYYETADAAEHARSGRHGYDTLVGAEFDAASGALTLTFECLCGEKSVRVIYLTEGDYVTEVDEDGVVTVRYDVAGTMKAFNGSVYAYSASGELTLPAITEGKSGNGYSYAVVTLPGCEETGLDTYTYGDGKGVVVRVVTPVSHVVGEALTLDGVTYYYCSRCGKYVTDAHSDAQYDNPSELVSDVGYQNSYNEKKDEALAELEDKKDEIIAGIDKDTPGYEDIIKVIEKVFDELYDEISGMDYEAQTESGAGRDSYAAALEEALEEALSGAMVEVEKTAREEVSRNVLQDTYNRLYDSGKYSDEALDELKGELDAAMADLEAITVTSEDDIAEIYDAYLERVLAALYAIRITRADTTGDSDHQGYVESSDGLSSGVEVVIVELDLEDYTFSSDADLLYKGSEKLSESEVSALVEGKGIVAVFDISLVDSESGTEIYVFSGTYFVRVELPQYLLGYDGLQVVYVGDDGRVEVYDTSVNDGYLEFTTTHFSEYIILGVGGVAGEKDTDLMGAIIALAVVSGVLLILMVVLLVIFLRRRNGGKKVGCAASMALLAALLSVTPSGGVAIVVVLGVVALALLVADIIFIVEIVKGPALITSALEEGTVTGDEIVASSSDLENPDGSEGDEKTL